MKSGMPRTWITIGLFALCSSTMGQWGVRFTALQWESTTRRGDWNLLLGGDLDLSDRTSIGLDLTMRAGFFYSDEPRSIDQPGVYGDYILSQKCTGLTYRSQFFFSDNDGSAAYIGTFIGFRRLSQEATPIAYDNNGDTPSWARNSSGSTTFFPLGLRLGIRGSLEGFYGDLYMGVGTSLGGEDPLRAVYIDDRDGLAPLFIQAGYAIGFGK